MLVLNSVYAMERNVRAFKRYFASPNTAIWAVLRLIFELPIADQRLCVEKAYKNVLNCFEIINTQRSGAPSARHSEAVKGAENG